MTEWPFRTLRKAAYGVILADPPWSFQGYTSDGVPQRASEQHYQTMTIDEMDKLPVWKLAAPDCALFMWSIASHTPQAFELGRRWGFEFKSKAFTWAKLNPKWQSGWDDGWAPTNDRYWHLGLGHGTRRNTEDCWLFTRGNPKRLSGGVRELIVSPRREHSRKPEETHDRIEKLFQGPYAELFSRESRPGWRAWGNQTGILDA